MVYFEACMLLLLKICRCVKLTLNCALRARLLLKWKQTENVAIVTHFVHCSSLCLLFAGISGTSALTCGSGKTGEEEEHKILRCFFAEGVNQRDVLSDSQVMFYSSAAQLCF